MNVQIRSVPVEPVTSGEAVYYFSKPIEIPISKKCQTCAQNISPSPALLSMLYTKRHSSYSQSLRNNSTSSALQSLRFPSRSELDVSTSPSSGNSSANTSNIFDDSGSFVSINTESSSLHTDLSSNCLSMREAIPKGCDPLSVAAYNESLLAKRIPATNGCSKCYQQKKPPSHKKSLLQLVHKWSSEALSGLASGFWQSEIQKSERSENGQETNMRGVEAEKGYQSDSSHGKALDVQLQTYRTVYSAIPREEGIAISGSRISGRLTGKSTLGAKGREPRINSEFLKFYALDYSCRVQDYLRISDQELDLYDREYEESGCSCIDEFLDRYIICNEDSDDSFDSVSSVDVAKFRNCLKLSLLSRHKLWNNVILPPREDLPNCIRGRYVHETHPSVNGAGLVRTGGKYMPWLNITDFGSSARKSIPPCGKMADGTQFTVKGWCNERWCSH
ncbi:hypothetical protein HII12_002453 [Brettanomyces bruxellensis]|uniref:DEBR0S1_11034g1_1 n=1 Tax=Dekkera bruxellensis TaxID=5007 RepID=A0A7D9GZD0_DEKBR|nr:hypothetical protein HII12_002453 [Brettanomyces bruxellensis]VUG16224.1 DEBR0S1_11034g1_1 [Brettanomyces bruxellensis]